MTTTAEDARLDTARRILDLLTEARCLWLLMDEEEQRYYTVSPDSSDRCDLGDELNAASAHVRTAVRGFGA